jgi:predicted nuclease with RNAse H fold
VSGAVAVGVDVAEAAKGLDLVGLDQDLGVVVSRGGLSVAEAARLILVELRPRIVAVDSPSGWSAGARSRSGERALSRMGVSVFATGPDPGDHPFYRWMRQGMSLFTSLAESYPLFRGDDPEGRAAEVYPNASACLLAGHHRRPGESKVAFRRAVLSREGLAQADLPNADRVDAALAALTGVLALRGCWSAVGDSAEGTILLPVKELPGRVPPP